MVAKAAHERAQMDARGNVRYHEEGDVFLHLIVTGDETWVQTSKHRSGSRYSEVAFCQQINVDAVLGIKWAHSLALLGS
jgi:hypothetical protein